MQKKQSSYLILPADMNYLNAVQSYIAELAKNAGLKSKEIKLFNLGIEEAITNVVKHAYLPDEKGTYEVVCEITPLEFRAIIKDKGLPFSPDAVEQFLPDKISDSAEKPGLGFRLMKGSVDKLSFHNKGWGGKEVHLVKDLKKKHIIEYVEDSKLQAYKETESKDLYKSKKIPYHIELLKPEYAVEISQCAYRTYGYSYIMENIYYPKRLIKMSQAGDLISALAVTDTDLEVMSHAALERFGYKKNIPELGMAFTKPKFRGQGCLNMINSFLVKKAKNLKIKGIYVKGVTSHTYSQMAAIKYGFKECAVLIGLSPPKQFKKMNKSLKQRESLVVSYRRLLNIEPKKIYIPEHHHRIIAKIYNNLALKMSLALPTKTNKKSRLVQSETILDINELLKYANIFVEDASPNFIEECKQKLKELCQKKIETINIYLNIYNNRLAKYVKGLEELGFFFAGIFPANEKQYLILQYLNYVPIDYDKIELFTDFSKELLKYIKNQDPHAD